LWYQITLSLNPWNKKHWIKKRFFDPIYGVNEEFKKKPKKVKGIFALSTNYFVNEFIDQSFKDAMERLREQNPKRYKVAGLGDWGISSGLVFEHWQEKEFDEATIMSDKRFKHVYAMDFGYKADPTAFIHLAVDEKMMEIYAVEEHYEKGMTNKKIADMLKYKGHSNKLIIADSSEPKSIDRLYELGIWQIEPAVKGNDSVRNGIDKLQDYTIIANRAITPNFCTELDNYQWDAEKSNVPVDDFNHLINNVKNHASVKYKLGKKTGTLKRQSEVKAVA
jgi:phage terminase large subunit